MTISSTTVQAHDGPSAQPKVSPRSTPYDPATETDNLIRALIEVDEQTGEVVMRGTLYPVWSVVLNLRATGCDRERVRRMFPELSLDALRAAERFWLLHSDEIRAYVEQ